MSDLISRTATIEEIRKTIRDAVAHDVITLLMEQPSLEQEPNWIPCSERLPEEDGKYLVTIHKIGSEEELGFELDDVDVRKLYFNTEHGWTIPKNFPSWIDDAITTDVLAWMPLPEPHKGAKMI